MAIPDSYKNNFEVLLSASANGDLALVECADKASGKPVYAVCICTSSEDGSVDIIPVAKLFDGSPFEELDGPEGAA